MYDECSFLAWLIDWPLPKPMSQLSQVKWIPKYLFKWIWLMDLNSVCIALCIFPDVVFFCLIQAKRQKLLLDVAADWMMGFIVASKSLDFPHRSTKMSNMRVLCVLICSLSQPLICSFKETWCIYARGKHAETHKECLLVWEVCRKEERDREKRSDIERGREEKQSELKMRKTTKKSMTAYIYLIILLARLFWH